jgi:hypothetical protein
MPVNFGLQYIGFTDAVIVGLVTVTTAVVAVMPQDVITV